jgi:FtsP/CotA-like multicopper oxidase with cupredoxin domain
MKTSLAAAISTAVLRAVAIVLGGIAVCASILGAVGFALVALYSFLAPDLGSAAAAFATSGAALAVPLAATVVIVVATRAARPAPIAAVTTQTAQPAAEMGSGLDRALDWINENPRTAALGALSFGVVMGAYPELRTTVLEGVDTALTQARETVH